MLSDVSVGLVCSAIRSCSPPNCRRQDALAVDGELDLLRILEATHRAQVRAIEADLEVVLGIQRKGVRGAEPADRSQRQSFEVNVLREILACGVGAAADADARVADSDRADPARRGEVRLQQCRRAALSIRDVVETERRTVGW